MLAVVQRVSRAEVRVDEEIVGAISSGLFVLLGVGHEDDADDVSWLGKKVSELRIFSDENNRMNLSVQDVEGSVLVVSQFTLLGNCNKGRRPSFAAAAEPVRARELYEAFVAEIAGLGLPVETGEFGATMQVTSTNDGPVTLWIDSGSRSRRP